MALALYTDAACTTRVNRVDSLGNTTSGIQAQLPTTLSTVDTLYLKDDVPGYRTPAAVTAYMSTSRTASAPDADTTISANGSSFVANASPGVSLGIVTANAAVPVYIKQTTGKASGSQNAYLWVTFGGNSILLPALSGSIGVQSAQTSLTVTAAFSATTTSVKYITKTANSAPSDADWAAVSASSALLAGSVTVTATTATPGVSSVSLTAGTDYYTFVKPYDADGISVTPSSAYSPTSAGGTSTSFSSQPSASSVTSQGFTVAWNVSNPLATWKISIDGGAQTIITPSGAGPYTYAVTGLTANASHTVVIVNTNGKTTVNSNTLTQSTAALTAPTVSAAAHVARITATWSAPDAYAVSYEAAYATSDPGSGASATSTGVTSPYDIAGTNGTAEYVRIRSVDAAGNKSAWSSVASATPNFSHSTTGLIMEDDFSGALSTNWIGNAFNTADNTAIPSQLTVASGKLHMTATDTSLIAIRPKSAIFPVTTTDQVIQGKLATGISAIGTSTNGDDSVEFAARQSHDANGYRYKMSLGRTGASDAGMISAWRYGVGGYVQQGSTASSLTIASGDVISFSVIGGSTSVAVRAIQNGTVRASSVDTANRLLAGRPYLLCFDYTSPNNKSYDFLDIVTMMAGESVTVTGLPTGYKAELTDSVGGSVTVKVTASSGTAVVNGCDTSVTALASGSKFSFCGGATLKIYDGSNNLVATQTGVYGGDSWAA